MSCRQAGDVALAGGERFAALFAAVDRRDVAGFMAFLADDCVFRFGNVPPVVGREAVGQAVAAFLAGIQALSHEICAVVEAGGCVACHGQVHYVRRDGSTLTVPFADFFTLRQGKICEYLIFIDISAL